MLSRRNTVATLLFVARSIGYGCLRMARFTDTVMIKDGGRERAVKVTVDAPMFKHWRRRLGFSPQRDSWLAKQR